MKEKNKLHGALDRNLHSQFVGRNLAANNEKNTDRDLHNQFVEYGRNAKDWLRKCALLLPEIDRRQIWRKRGFSSILEYAAKLAGMSEWAVRDSLRILQKVEDKPALRKVIEDYGLNRVRPVATLATTETDKFWAEKARTLSKNTLEAYVRSYRKEFGTRTNLQSVKNSDDTGLLATNDEPSPIPKTLIEMELPPDLAVELTKLKGDNDWETLIRELLEIRNEKLEREKPATIESAPRYIAAGMQKYVVGRTNGRCAFQGCNKPIDILHHTQRYALEKVHDPDRLWGLCKAHERLAHAGLIENEEGHPRTWRLRREPDKNNIKYWIDQQVATYRH